MALSPQIMQAYREYDPNGTPEDAQRMLDYLKNANPDMQVDDETVIGAFNDYKNPPSTPGTASAPLAVPAQVPVVAAPAPAPVDTYQPKYTAERLAELQAQIAAKRNEGSLSGAIANIAAGFGGPAMIAAREETLKKRRDQEQQPINDFLQLQAAERADISMKKTARMEQAAAEQARQLTDPNSSASKAAFNGLKIMASNNPRLMSIIDQMRPEDMTAANLTQLIPSLKIAVEYDFKQQKLTNDREVADAKQEAARAKDQATQTYRYASLALRGSPQVKIADVQKAVIAEQKFDTAAAEINKEISAANATTAALDRATELLTKKDAISPGGVVGWFANKLPSELQSPDRVELDSIRNQIIADVQQLQKGPQTEADAARYGKILNLMSSNPAAGIKLYKDKLEEDKKKKILEIRSIEQQKARMRASIGDDTPVEPYLTDTRPPPDKTTDIVVTDADRDFAKKHPEYTPEEVARARKK